MGEDPPQAGCAKIMFVRRDRNPYQNQTITRKNRCNPPDTSDPKASLSNPRLAGPRIVPGLGLVPT